MDAGGDDGDADLASLLGPIAADVGGMLGSGGSAAASAAASARGSPSRQLPLGAHLSPHPGSAAPMLPSPQRQQPASLLDALALTQREQATALQQQSTQATESHSALYAVGVGQVPPGQDGGLLGALAAWRVLG